MNTCKTISLSLVMGSNKTFQREGWEGGRNSVRGVMKSKDLISRFWHEGISQEFIFAILRGKYEKKGCSISRFKLSQIHLILQNVLTFDDCP